MAKFNPYKIDPFKVLNVIGWVFRFTVMALALTLFCYAAVMIAWDSWGWWALTMPLIWAIGFSAVVAICVTIGGGYYKLKMKYEDAKWKYERREFQKQLDTQENRITEMEEDHV